MAGKFLNIQKGLRRTQRVLTRPAPAKIKRVNFALTYACQSRCIGCSIWKINLDNPALAKSELSTEEIQAFFSGTPFLDGLDEIALTGGEPFLRKDFPELFRFFRSRFPHATLVITTNGLSVRQGWLESADVDWTVLVFSLDGIGQTNDLIRGIEGDARRVLATVETFRAKFPSLRMGLSFTLMPENLSDLGPVYELAKRLGLSFTMRFEAESEIFYGPATGRETGRAWTEEMLERAEAAIQDIVADMARRRDPVRRLLNPDLYFFSQLVTYQREQRRLAPCYSGTHSFFLDPYGNVFPCIFLEQPMGNIRDKNFESFWLSANAEQVRQSIYEEKCHCWTECETIPSLQRDLLNFKEKRGAAR